MLNAPAFRITSLKRRSSGAVTVDDLLPEQVQVEDLGDRRVAGVVRVDAVAGSAGILVGVAGSRRAGVQVGHRVELAAVTDPAVHLLARVLVGGTDEHREGGAGLPFP